MHSFAIANPNIKLIIKTETFHHNTIADLILKLATITIDRNRQFDIQISCCIVMNIHTIPNWIIGLAITLYYNIFRAIANLNIELAITIEMVYHNAIVANINIELAAIAIDINSSFKY